MTPENNKNTWRLKICAGIRKDNFVGTLEPQYVTVLKKIVKYTMYRGFISFGTHNGQEKVWYEGFVLENCNVEKNNVKRMLYFSQKD